MDAYLLDWVNLLLRWAHVITAIAWIGSSFYFVLLDNSLSRPEHDELKTKGVDGEMWAVHGGGFYHANKYMLAPRWRALPEHLHWSYWESYSTWLTGFALFTVLYLFNAGSFLIDKSVFDWSPRAAIFAALAFLVVFWGVYDFICRLFGERENGDLIVGVLVFAVRRLRVVARLPPVRRPRGLPAGGRDAGHGDERQRLLLDHPRPAQGGGATARRAAAATRSTASAASSAACTTPTSRCRCDRRCCPTTTAGYTTGKHNWIVLVLLMLAGALIRHSFVARHKAHVEHAAHAVGARGGRHPGPVRLGVVAGARAAVGRRARGRVQPVAFGEVKAVVDQRCALCHNAQVQQKNVALHTPELIKQHAQNVYQQVAVLKLMPLNNATQITDEERALIQRWFEAGAPTR